MPPHRAAVRVEEGERRSDGAPGQTVCEAPGKPHCGREAPDGHRPDVGVTCGCRSDEVVAAQCSDDVDGVRAMQKEQEKD